MSDCILRMSNINKSFFGVPVLKEARLEVLPGEVHVLLGENGAGKSTLIKILSGAYTREGGLIEINGQAIPAISPKEALNIGISVIYQEFNLIPDLPVYENIFVGKEFGKGIFVDHKQAMEKAEVFMKKVGLNVSPKTLVKDLSVAQKQLVEIAKAISNHVKILVLDEPTAAITEKESDMLFEIIKELQKEKIGIIYISHRMKELFEIGDRCTVMRDGEYVGTVNLSETSEDELTKMMVGRTVNFEKNINNLKDNDQVVLEVNQLQYRNYLKDISFQLHKGEILGFAGLVGAGRTEVAKCVVGALKKTGGSVKYKNTELSSSLPENIRKGIVYLSEDRKEEGLVLSHSVMDNIVLPNLSKLAKPFLRKKEMVCCANNYIQTLRIKTHSHLTEVQNLSGGNQQKVVIAKWLYSEADICIFDEPTRGIDVGAREEIYNIMKDLIEQGKSIIMISSDLVEILKMCDRVAVMREGMIETILENNADLTQEIILKYAMQGGE
ncbi:sugar ABC transporter ATP-binding protein [Clostridiales bacterium COT073_COT-073]|nr:sugar ABC transporter ATP-binding protein [Clostridiales bacterium COT073_COT-073]